MRPRIIDTRRFALIHEAGERFDAIMAAIDTACERYAAEQPPAWSLDVNMPDVSWMRAALCDMWHDGQGNGVSTSKHAGVVAASPALRDDFRRINEAKSAFQDIITAMKDTKPAYNFRTQIKEQIAHRHPGVHEHLKTAGMARLSLKKTWRRVFIVDRDLRRMGIGWYVSGRSIVKISVAEAEKRLLLLSESDPNIAIQLKQLASIPPSEILAWVKPQAPVLRFNFYYDDDDMEENDQGSREQVPPGKNLIGVHSSLPVLVPPYSPNGLLPPLRTPSMFPPPPKKTRKRRSDAKIEEEPFLPSISVHRYLPQKRLYAAQSSRAG